MGAKEPVHGIDLIDGYIKRCNDFMNLWLRFSQILSAYPRPGANKVQLESQFLSVKSELARQYRVLTDRLGGDAKFGPELMNVMSGATDLASIYSQSEVAVKKLENEWHRSFITINETLGNIEDKRRRAAAGERVHIGGQLVYIHQRKPIPWRRILSYSGVAASVLTVFAVVYFMRYFLGFWAPAAGAGIEVTAGMSDAEMIQVLLVTMEDAVARQDVDQLMTTYSDRFRDADGHGKTELRVAIQGFKTAGEMDGVSLDFSETIWTMGDGIVDLDPVYVRTGDGDVRLRVVASREDDKWLITYLEGL